jgi:hypothetical protein
LSQRRNGSPNSSATQFTECTKTRDPFLEEHPMRKITKRSAAVIAVTAVAIGGGAAWAAWLVTGDGETTVQAGKSVKLDLAGSPIIGTLVPGSTSDIKFDVENQNKFPVQIKTIKIAPVKSDNAKCVATDNVKATEAALPAANLLKVPAANDPANKTNVGKLSVTYPGAIRMVVAPEDACQNATFTFSIDVSGESASATATP